MSFWLTVDEETQSMTGLSGQSRESISDRGFNLELDDCPMAENVFYYMFADVIRNMRIGESEYLSIGYPDTRPDGISAVQTCKTAQNGFNVEIIVKDSPLRPFSTYGRIFLTADEAIDVFKTVLCDYKAPDIDSWNDVTDIIQFEI